MEAEAPDEPVEHSRRSPRSIGIGLAGLVFGIVVLLAH
jgi:hypothetical protein